MASIKNKSETVHVDLSSDKLLQQIIDGYKKNPKLKFISDHMSKNKLQITKDLTKLLPDKSCNPKSYKFHLMNSNTQMANAFRRVFRSELPMTYFDCKYEDFDSDDPKLLRCREYIIQRLNSITLDQEAVEKLNIDPENPTLQFVLESKNEDVHTLSIENKVVHSSDMMLFEKVKGKWVRVNNNQKYFKFCQTIRITHLMKAKYVKIRINLTNLNSVNNDALNRGSYAFKPLEFKEPYPNSFSVHPKNYELSITNNGYTNCLWTIKKVWNTIIARLNRVLEALEEAQKTNEIPYISSIIGIEKLKGEDNKYKYKLFNETHTIGNLIAWHTFKIDETGFINCGDDHPKDPFIVIIIKQYKDHLDMIVKGAKSAIAEAEKILTQF